MRYGPNPERFQGFETLIVPFPGSFWAVEGRVYESPTGIGTSADRGASSESKILRAAARRQRRMGTSDGPQHVPQNVRLVNSCRQGALGCASALQGAACEMLRYTIEQHFVRAFQRTKYWRNPHSIYGASHAAHTAERIEQKQHWESISTL